MLENKKEETDYDVSKIVTNAKDYKSKTRRRRIKMT